MKQTLLSALLLTLFGGCQPNSEATQTKNYYDLKGFLETQIKLLNAQKPKVLKQTAVSATQDNQTVSNLDWAKELELFMQADLNKASYQLSYDTRILADSTYEYQLKATEKLPVKYLKIKLNTAKQVARAEALILQENKLYNSEKHLLLTCGTSKNNVWQLKTYEVEGFQKLAFNDKKTFSVRAVIVE
jgi:hypothetical protein